MSQNSQSAATHLSLFRFLFWLGGFFAVWNAPGGSFLDGLIWPYYLGRYIATHFTIFTS